MVLSDYISDLRFVLEEFPSPGVFWTDAQLTLCINKARDRISLDCLCCRSLATVPAIQGQLVYTYNNTLQYVQEIQPAARSISEIINVNFTWSPSFQPPLRRYGWSEFNAKFLINPSIQSQVMAFGKYDLQSIYIWPPAPNSSYTFQADCSWLPVYLVNNTDVDAAIPEIVGRPLVPLMAARWALYFSRDYVASASFKAEYMEEKTDIMSSLPPWSVESYYDD